MPAELSDDPQTAVSDLLSRLNGAWMHKSGEEMSEALNACFAEDVVMRGSGFVLLGKGRALAVQSYHDFVGQAQVKGCSLEQPEVDVAGNTATAQYKWEMTYVL